MNAYFRRRQRDTALTIAFTVAVFAAVVAAVSCCHTPAPVVSPDATFVEATCETACANLERLHCPESKPNAKGMTCPQVCQHAERLRDMNLACVTTASDLASLSQCGSVRCVW
jgi:hypothetical protein